MSINDMNISASDRSMEFILNCNLLRSVMRIDKYQIVVMPNSENGISIAIPATTKTNERQENKVIKTNKTRTNILLQLVKIYEEINPHREYEGKYK